MIHSGFPALLIASSGAVADDMHTLAARLKQLRAQRILITDDNVLLGQADLALPLPMGMPEWLTPMVLDAQRLPI